MYFLFDKSFVIMMINLVYYHKINLVTMHLKSRPEGYVSAFDSHIDPAYSNPPIKLSQQKQQQTLLGVCLKSFIKERLYGNFINYNKQPYTKRYNFTPPLSSLPRQNQLQTSIPFGQSLIKRQDKERMTNFERRVRDRQERYYSQLQSRNPQKIKAKISHRNSIGGSSIDTSFILNSRRYRDNKTNLDHKSSLANEKHHQYDLQRYPGASFISAIEDSQQLKKSRLVKRQAKTKLSPLSYKTQLIEKLEKVKNKLGTIKKNTGRPQIEKYTIKASVWDYFCQVTKTKTVDKQLKNSSYITTESGVPDSIFNVSKPLASRSIQPNRSLLSIEKSKITNYKNNFIRESFMDYLNNNWHCNVPLANQIYSFFQLNPKIYDEMKMDVYKKNLQVMVMSSSRVWAISTFRFWDLNQDGIICSKDIFMMYQILTSQQDRFSELVDYKQYPGYIFTMKLKQILEDLRSIILELKLQSQLEKRNTGQQPDRFEIKYLQQALLRKKQLKYSDLLLVLGQGIQTATKDVKKSVIEFAKQLNMKFSSCYRFSFLATDHNEQTREDREHIENLKEKLKQQKIELKKLERNQCLQNEKIPGIDYKTYFERQVYLKMKDISLQIFGVQLIS